MREATPEEIQQHNEPNSGRSYYGQCELDVVYIVTYDDNHAYVSAAKAIEGAQSHARWRRKTGQPAVRARCKTLKKGGHWQISVEFSKGDHRART